MRHDIAYLLLAVLIIGGAAVIYGFVRHQRAEHQRIWGRPRRRR